MKVHNINEIHTHIKVVTQSIQKLQQTLEKYQAQLNDLPPLKLSEVYKDGLVYGLCYSDGHGTIEALNIMDNQPERLIERAKKLIKDYLNEKLYVVGFKPESIYAVVEGGKTA